MTTTAAMVYTRLVIACLYDVHGNLPALEAVLADLGDAERYILGGDYALFGGWPGETVARLRELEPALWIRGNGERWTADPPEELREAVAAVRGELGDELVAELGALPETAEDGDMLICHGSPVSDVRSFLPEPAEDESELLAGDHRAAYAVIHDDGGLEHRRAAYDHVASAGEGALSRRLGRGHGAADRARPDGGALSLPSGHFVGLRPTK